MKDCSHRGLRIAMYPQDGFTITDATLVDPSTRQVARRALSVVDGRISYRKRCPRAFTGHGLFVAPGLIDMHVHLVPSRESGNHMADDLLGICRARLRSALESGVTTLRDLGGPLEILLPLRRAQAEGTVAGSRLRIAGPAISVPHGHGVHSGHGVAIATPVDARNVVSSLAEISVDYIKIITSGARGAVQMPAEVMRVVADTANARGLPIAVHAHFQPNQLEESIRLGVTTLEHGFMLHEHPHLLDQMASDNVFLCPTLRVIEAIREDDNWCGQRLIPNAFGDAKKTTARAFNTGVNLIAGTDAGVYGAEFGDVWREIGLIGECTTRWEGLRAVTTNAAIALGMPELGNLEEGTLADLVVLDRNPLRDDVDRHNIVAVIQEGAIAAGSMPETRPC